ncbi:MAG: hypothetical protein ACRD3T_15095 [Terriglobia bacterium]
MPSGEPKAHGVSAQDGSLQRVATVSAFLTVGFSLESRPTVNPTAIDRGYRRE